ncbi:MAG TPA: YhjD/YihY/BrkB family envelope integrity protein [Candidatus Dormibacteraeota bacterium]|nr:YhjD/YihY/BrkB family envelope integrity protein [Candidatus Dormibacteraeota bacterium]
MRHAKRFVVRYLECGASQYGGMLAYSLFVSLIPLALGVVSLDGLVSQSPKRFAAFRQLLAEVFPPDVQSQVREALLGASQHAGTIIVLSLIGLAWFSTGLFSTTGFALNQIYGFRNRSFWAQRLRGLWFPVALIVATLIAILVEYAIHLLKLPRLVGLVGVWLALAALILFMYRLAPGKMLSRSQLAPGAAVAALAIVLFGYGLTFTTQLSFQLGSDTRFFAEVFALAAWVYFIAQAILFGAVLNQAIIEGAAT